jgi:hypothetical protein
MIRYSLIRIPKDFVGQFFKYKPILSLMTGKMILLSITRNTFLDSYCSNSRLFILYFKLVYKELYADREKLLTTKGGMHLIKCIPLFCCKVVQG